MKISFVRIGTLLICIFVLSATIVFIIPLLLPFLLGWLISAALHPIVGSVQNWTKLPPTIAILLSLILIVGILISTFSILFMFIANEIIQFSQLIPTYTLQFFQFIQDLFPLDWFQNYYLLFQDWYSSISGQTITDYSSQVSEGVQWIVQQVVHLLQQIVTGVLQFFASLPSAATIVLFTLLATFFISKDFTQINDWIVRQIPISLQKIFAKVAVDLKEAFHGFIRAQFVIICVTTIISIIGLSLLRVPHAFALGMLLGLIDVIPMLGTGTIILPWMIYSFFIGNYPLVIGLSIMYAMIIVVRQLIEPKLIAQGIGLPPLITLMAIFAGLQLIGVLGMIVAPFIVLFIRSLYRASFFNYLWNFVHVDK